MARVSDFDYELPPEHIAQEPAVPRDAARLLLSLVKARACEHHHVRDLEGLLEPGDLLVVNDTRVRPARLYGERTSGGQVELLLLGRASEAECEAAGEDAWRAMVRPAKKLKPGERISLAEGRARARMLVRDMGADGHGEPYWTVVIESEDDPSAAPEELLERYGRMPLPPYIERPVSARDAHTGLDRERYQTVFARESGAVAAPTAGLHFGPELLGRLAERGVERAAVTLHVGIGTFRPVMCEDTRDHVMHTEAFELTEETARAVNACRARGGRVVCVGTTSVRTLESCASAEGVVSARSGTTDLFIEPGYRFRAVDLLLTNFHLPKSTLLMLVSAFHGRERVLALYAEAIAQGYRFYSYGDAMLLDRDWQP